MAYQVPRFKKQAPITKMLHALFTQGIPQYASYKMQQKEEKENKKREDREWKAKETQGKLDFYTAMTKDVNPAVRGRAVSEIEKILGVAPYSVVAGRQRLQPTGYPQQRGMLQPGRMQMGPQRGGVMTRRPPALSEMISGAEPVPEKKTGKFTMSDLKLNIALKYMRKEKLTEEEERILFSPSLMEQFFGMMGDGQMGQGQSGTKPPLSELLK